MNKDDKIDYIANIARYLNLSAVCNKYNQMYADKIDYNNLRVVIKRQSTTRLSEDKLDNFIKFLRNDFLLDIFNITSIEEKLISNVKDIVKKETSRFYSDLKERITNELSNK